MRGRAYRNIEKVLALRACMQGVDTGEGRLMIGVEQASPEIKHER
jgi:hypothetical protein